MDALTQTLRICGFTRVPHVEMIAAIRDAINSSGGCVLDSHLFSNAVLSIQAEIRADNVPRLFSSLEDAGLHVDATTAASRDSWRIDTEADAVVNVALSVNFLHDDPPLRIEVPAVPG